MGKDATERRSRSGCGKNSRHHKNGGCRESHARKALIVTTVSGFVPQFEMDNVRILQKMGYEVHYASNFRNVSFGTDNHRLEGTGIVCHQVEFARSPFCVSDNVMAYRQLKKLLIEQQFRLLHCHTPVAAALARLAAEFCRKQGKGNGAAPTVIYTAHGFHFYKGAPFWYWLLFYPAERWLARLTDILITINQEDYKRAKKFRMRKVRRSGRRAGEGGGAWKQVFYVEGVGIGIEKYQAIRADRDARRREIGVGEEEFLLLSVGELSKRKNHQMVIRALAELQARTKPSFENWNYLIVGDGRERKKLELLIQRFRLQKKVILAGYQMDVRRFLAAADCFVFPSKQEGLPVALLEAAAAGLPCIVSDIRGNREIVRDDRSRFRLGDKKGLETLIARTYRFTPWPASDCAEMPMDVCMDGEEAVAGSVPPAQLKKFEQQRIRRKMETIYEQAGKI